MQIYSQRMCQKEYSQDDVATRDMTSSNNQSDVFSRNDENDGKTVHDWKATATRENTNP